MGFALKVESYYPRSGEKDVSRTTPIQVGFNRDLKKETIAGNFIVEKLEEGIATSIEGTIRYEDKLITFVPSSPLDQEAKYRVTIVGDSFSTADKIEGIRDIFGDAMMGNLQITFFTDNSVVLATPVLLSPIANTKHSEVPEIRWGSIDEATSYEIQISNAAEFSIDLWDTVIYGGETSVVPGLVFSDGTYYVRTRYSVGEDKSPWSDSVRFFVEELFEEETPFFEEDIIESSNDEPTEEEEHILKLSALYSPLYCTYADVQRELGIASTRVNPDAIYSNIRDASLYARQVREYVENNNMMLSKTDWDNETDLPIFITQYVKYEAAYNSLAVFYINKASRSGAMKQLADLVIQEYAKGEEGLLKALEFLKARARQWLDQIMEFGIIRGYAKPTYAVRGETSHPYQEFHNSRTVWKE